ncbi:MAG: hypothetical protein M1541_04350 [Acidobacteria bacterium]|nr:hypothetical protein [Acidobacteriota bacterium]
MPDNDYISMLGLQDREFETSKGVWTAKVPKNPKQGMSDRLMMRIYFQAGRRKPGWKGPSIRNLDLWLSDFQLHHRQDEYRAEVYNFITSWLETDVTEQELECLGPSGARFSVPRRTSVRRTAG